MTTYLDKVREYIKAGLSVIPTNVKEKNPTVKWKPYQQTIASEQEIETWFGNGNGNAVAICAGKVSGNLELLDFDNKAELLKPFMDKVREDMPDLSEKLVVGQSQSKGGHIYYRCEREVDGNKDLAKKIIHVSLSECQAKEVKGKTSYTYQHNGKGYAVKDAENNPHIEIKLIETRGQGGYFLTAPSPGYKILRGDLLNLPVINKAERDYLINLARTFDEPPPKPSPVQKKESATCSTWEGTGTIKDFNRKVKPWELLQRDGWEYVRDSDGNALLKRPGKDGRGCSGGIIGGIDGDKFNCFTTNAPPFEANTDGSGHGYDSFEIYAVLNHHGDTSAAAKELYRQGYGDRQERNTEPSRPEPPPQGQERPAPPPITIKCISAKDLQKKEFPEMKWLIPDILVEGTTLLGGKPKMGKSAMVLNIAVGIASGTSALGREVDTSGPVLYLSLEDGERRAKDRLEKLLPDTEWPESLFIYEAFPRMGEGGIENLTSLVEEIKPVLVIIDTLKGFKEMPKGRNTKQLYDLDYESIMPITRLADQHRLSIIIVHHFRKAQNPEDFTDSFSGSTGLTGAVTTLAGLEKRARVNILSVRGKEIADEEFGLSFDKDRLEWQIIGYASEVKNTADQQSVFDCLVENAPSSKEAISRKEIITLSGVNEKNADRILAKFLKDGSIHRGKYGKYYTTPSTLHKEKIIESVESRESVGSVESVESVHPLTDGDGKREEVSTPIEGIETSVETFFTTVSKADEEVSTVSTVSIDSKKPSSSLICGNCPDFRPKINFCQRYQEKRARALMLCEKKL